MPKRTLKCPPTEHRYTVVQVNQSRSDTSAARSFAEAYAIAIPDPGSRVDVWAVCAPDAGSARLLFSMKDLRRQHLRTLRAKR